VTDEGAPFVAINPEDLEPATLEAVIVEFVSREGTDYGHAEHSLDDKVAAVRRQLARGEARIVFDPDSETTTILPTER
jgi:uncharacterized protein YheU (UPF0270 family)